MDRTSDVRLMGHENLYIILNNNTRYHNPCTASTARMSDGTPDMCLQLRVFPRGLSSASTLIPPLVFRLSDSLTHRTLEELMILFPTGVTMVTEETGLNTLEAPHAPPESSVTPSSSPSPPSSPTPTITILVSWRSHLVGGLTPGSLGRVGSWRSRV